MPGPGEFSATVAAMAYSGAFNLRPSLTCHSLVRKARWYSVLLTIPPCGRASKFLILSGALPGRSTSIETVDFSVLFTARFFSESRNLSRKNLGRLVRKVIRIELSEPDQFGGQFERNGFHVFKLADIGQLVTSAMRSIAGYS